MSCEGEGEGGEGRDEDEGKGANENTGILTPHRRIVVTKRKQRVVRETHTHAKPGSLFGVGVEKSEGKGVRVKGRGEGES